MNIGYLIKFPWYPPTSGASVHAFQLAQNLVKRGHKLKTISFWNQPPDLQTYRRRELLKFIREIDVLYMRLHGNWTFEHWTLLKMLRPFRLPVVWEINSPLEEAIDMKTRTKNEVKTMNAGRQILGRMVNAGICVSDVMKEYAVDYLGIKNSHVIPNGSDLDQFSPSKRDNDLYKEYGDSFKVLWSGSANYPWQGIDLISKVAEKIYTIDKKIKFILISKKNHLKKHSIFDKNIIFLDQKPYLEFAPYIASADVGLCLYKNYGWNGKFYFSPLKIFDYMACALPIIATDLGQISEIIRNDQSGLLTDNSVSDIVEKIIYLKKNEAERKRLGNQAREDVRRFYSWERVAIDTERVLQNVSKA